MGKGDIIPPVHPGVQTCLAELLSDKRVLGEVMGNVDAVSGTAAAANILSTQKVDGVVDLPSSAGRGFGGGSVQGGSSWCQSGMTYALT